jgi:natural product biosynthesis luciferase-like monooxygenase protein
MFRDILLIRRLWAGEEVEFNGVGGKPIRVRTLPRPIQPELPFWITVSSPQTWSRAGEVGANVLTALAGGSLEDLRRNIAKYRGARVENGHDPHSGIVSLMVHTYIDEDLQDVRMKVREPLKNYLRTFIDQFRPLFDNRTADSSSREMGEMLELAFERYFDDHSLLGTPEKCATMIARLAATGVNELACLVDFGIDLPSTLASLERLAAIRRSLNSERLRPSRRNKENVHE